MATATVGLTDHQKGKVMVPAQTPTLVSDARETAKVLAGMLSLEYRNFKNYGLAPFPKALDRQILINARGGEYLLAVDSVGLPDKEGWYQIGRTTDGVIGTDPINGTQAQKLMDERRWFEVLYVNQSAVDSARENLPVALGAGYGYKGRWCPYVYGGPDHHAFVVLAELKPEEKIATQSKIGDTLRLAPEDQMLEITVPNSTSTYTISASIAKVVPRR